MTHQVKGHYSTQLISLFPSNHIGNKQAPVVGQHVQFPMSSCCRSQSEASRGDGAAVEGGTAEFLGAAAECCVVSERPGRLHAGTVGIAVVMVMLWWVGVG